MLPAVLGNRSCCLQSHGPKVGRRGLCKANTRHPCHLSVPILSSQAAFSRDWLVLGRSEEPVADQAAGEMQGTFLSWCADPPSVLADEGRRLEGQTTDLAFPELVLAVLQGVVHLISAWHLQVFSQLSLLRKKCENLKVKEL